MLAQFHENFYPATIIAVKPITDGEHNRRALSLSLSLSLLLTLLCPGAGTRWT
jgi:hypothetical protein